MLQQPVLGKFIDSEVSSANFGGEKTLTSLLHKLNSLPRGFSINFHTGPSFTHLSQPVASHFLGHTSPASDPSAYLAAITALLTTYSHDVEYPLLDDAAFSHSHHRRGGAGGTGAHQFTRTAQNKIRDRVPLIINTQGWVKGLGADLLTKLKAEARPSHMLLFEPSAVVGGDDMAAGGADDRGNWSAASGSGGGSGKGGDPPLPNTEYQRMEPSSSSSSSSSSSYAVIRLAGAPSSPLDSKWSAADLRTLAFISYFHSIFPSASHHDGRTTNLFPLSWDFTSPLVSRTPFAVDWTIGQGQITGVHLLDSDVPYEQVLYALNGSIVALVQPSEEGGEVNAEEPQNATSMTTTNTNAFPLLSSPPLPGTSRALGLALIRSIDPSCQTLHLVTPVPIISSSGSGAGATPVLLVKGALDLPLPLQLDFNATEVESARGVCGTEWKDVPYLSVEGNEPAGRKKVRRNLMRRGQA